MKRLCTWVMRAGCLIAIAAGIVWNARAAVADFLARRHQPESLRAAMQAMPADGAYPAQFGDQVYATDPELAKSLLRKALALDPYDAASWIQLGLLYEEADDMPAAEAALLQAASADATFLPGWSLANFYFRRQNTPQFWRWAQRAAQMAPGDATPLFRLAWYVAPSVPVIESRLRLQRWVLESQFVNFLIAQGDPAAVSEAAAHLLQAGAPGSTQSIMAVCDWLLAARHPELALPLWNNLAAHRRIPYAVLTLGMTDTVTNGRFALQPISRGFDWRLATVNGVSSFLNNNPSALGFEFSGDEPDRFVLLTQSAPVEPQKTYALLVNYESSGISPNTGLLWTVRDNRTGALLAQTSLLGPPVAQTTACFTVLKDSYFIDLALGYQRRPGTVRPEGKLALSQVRLQEPSGQTCAKQGL